MTTTRLSLPALSSIFILAATIGAATGLSVSDRAPMTAPGFEAAAGAGAPLPMLPEGVRRAISPTTPASEPAGPALAM